MLEGRSVIPKCFVPSVLILTEFLYLTCFVLAATAEKFSVDNLGTYLRPEFTRKPTTKTLQYIEILMMISVFQPKFDVKFSKNKEGLDSGHTVNCKCATLL